MENTTNYLNETKPTIKTFVTKDATHICNLFLSNEVSFEYAGLEVDPAYSHQHTTPLQQMSGKISSEYARQEIDPAYSHQHTQHKSDGETTGFARPEVDPAHSHQHTASVQYKNYEATTSEYSRQEIDPIDVHHYHNKNMLHDGAASGLKLIQSQILLIYLNTLKFY